MASRYINLIDTMTTEYRKSRISKKKELSAIEVTAQELFKASRREFSKEEIDKVNEILGYSLDEIPRITPMMGIYGVDEAMVYTLVERGASGSMLWEIYQKEGIAGLNAIEDLSRNSRIVGMTIPPKGSSWMSIMPNSNIHYLEMVDIEEKEKRDIIKDWDIAPNQNLIFSRMGDIAIQKIYGYIESMRREYKRIEIEEIYYRAGSKEIWKAVHDIYKGELWVWGTYWPLDVVMYLVWMARALERIQREGEYVEEDGKTGKKVGIGGTEYRVLGNQRIEDYSVHGKKNIGREYNSNPLGNIVLTDAVEKGEIKEVESIDAIKALMVKKIEGIEMPQDINRRTLDKNKKYLRSIDSRRAQQVMVFRVGNAKAVYINYEKRMVEFMYIPEYSSMGAPLFHRDGLKIFGDSVLGTREKMDYWYIEKFNDGGLLVVPDSMWDKMTWLWENDIVLWPQIVEEEGVTTVVVPGFNGFPGAGKTCYGQEVKKNPKIYPYEERRSNPLMDIEMLMAGNTMSQQRRTKMLQEVLLTDEGNNPGNMTVRVPWNGFIKRLQELRERIKPYVEMENSIEKFTIIAKEVGRTIGALCFYGGVDGAVATWQVPWYNEKNKTWWWYREQEVEEGRDTKDTTLYGGVRCRRYNSTPHMEAIKKLREKVAVIGYVLGDMMPEYLEKGTEWLYKIAPEVIFKRVWIANFKGVYGIYKSRDYGTYILADQRECSDKAWKGDTLGDIPMKKILEYGEPVRMVGKTPECDNKERYFRANAASEDVRGLRLPMCGNADCRSLDCNSGRLYIGT